MLYEAYALCLQILQGLKLADSFNQDSDTQHCYFLLVTASHRFTLMNFNASKQWIKGTRNQLNGVLSVLYELIHSHCKGASIMYSNHWPSYCALSFQLFSLQWGLLYKLKPILSLVLKIIFLLKSNSRQVSCLARFFFVCLFTEIQMTKNSP